MKDPTTGVRAFGRTRWRRFLILLTPGVGIVAVLMFLVATGVIAVSFAISGIPFTLSASNLSGNHFVQYATVDPTTNTTADVRNGVNTAVQALTGDASAVSSQLGADGKTYDAVTVTVLGDGSITNLTQTICVALPPPLSTPLGLGPDLLVKIRAGDPAVTSSKVTFSDLVADAPVLTAGTATFTNINIGQDEANALSTQDPWFSPLPAAGGFAQSAASVSIDNIKQFSIATSAGSFALPGLTLSATFVASCS